MNGSVPSPNVRLVRRTHLALRSADALRESTRAPALGDVRLARRPRCAVDEYRALYRLVGERWHWRDRLAWSDERLAAWLARPEVQVWVLEVGGTPAGYFELIRHESGWVEIAYFGLADAAIGRGLGAWMLARAADAAWAAGATWVGLNTCTLDGPTALPNYLARGFVPYRTEEYVAVL
jgi:GNAT superfamily N-acetyltransferase